jgi:cyanophycinase
VAAARAAVSPVPDIFDSALAPGFTAKGFTLTDAALDLAGAGRSRMSLGTTYETGPRFVVELRKGNGFAAYRRGDVISFADMDVSMYSS